MKKHFFFSGIVSSIAAALIGCETTSDIAAVKEFEPERYMGPWYEIARLPQWRLRLLSRPGDRARSRRRRW